MFELPNLQAAGRPAHKSLGEEGSVELADAERNQMHQYRARQSKRSEIEEKREATTRKEEENERREAIWQKRMKFREEWRQRLRQGETELQKDEEREWLEKFRRQRVEEDCCRRRFG